MEKVSVFKLIVEDFSTARRKDPAIRSRVELFFNYPGVWSLATHRVAHKLHGLGLRRLSRVLSGLTQIATGIDLHPAAKVGRRVFIDHGLGVVIGETTIIGDDVTIYQGVSLGGVSLERKKRHPTIEDGVVIGAGAKVLGDITIGKNAKIGANSVVIKPVPPDSTAIGLPARVIEKGRSKSPMDLNKIPDIDSQLFGYLLKRVAIIEHALAKTNIDIEAEDKQLEEIYKAFLDSIK
ncbi:MAG: serine O-acetyltransferase [Campylobacterales bacterium]